MAQLAPNKPIKQMASRHAPGLSTVLLVCSVIFGPALWCGECPAYRDAGHFYLPTLKYTTERWAAGEIPLWNELDNAGQPLAADATSAVFYPGRVLLHLPIGIERAITVFVLCHWLLAIFGVRRLAKRYSDSTEVQYFVGLLFGLSGYVAGQTFNVVFLVGAAWLPWAWDAWESLRGGRDTRKAVYLAIPLAMMVLGGDPQISYHVVLLALLDSISWRRTTRDAASAFLEPTLVEGTVAKGHLTWPWFRSRWVVLLFACSLALGLCAIQVVPSLTWTLRTDRAVFDEPRSIWEWFAGEGKSSHFSAILAPPKAGTHDENLYDFSFAPIRMLEFVVPGIFGELGPCYQNWLKGFVPSQRWWTSTNYLGLLPLALATWAVFGNWSNRHVRSAVSVALIALISSFGVWGIGAIWQWSVRRAGGIGDEIGPAVGGLYWFWVSFLPGYSGFRYPSKWLVFFTLAILLLAARGMDLLRKSDGENESRHHFRTYLFNGSPYFFVLLSGICSLFWLTLLLLGSEEFTHWAKIPPHPLFGPFDVDGALRCMRFALARTFCVSLILAGLLFAIRGPGIPAIRYALMLITLLEVTLFVWYGSILDHAEYWMKAPVEPACVAKIAPSYRVYRAASSRLQPKSWQLELDSNRMEAIRTWEQATLVPRYHWLSKTKLTEAHGTTMSADYAALLDFLHRCPPDDREEPAWSQTFHPYDLLSARYCIVPQGEVIRDANVVESAEMVPLNFTFWERAVTPPRAWVAKSVVLKPELGRVSRSELAERTSQILLERDRFRDLLRESVIESDSPDPLFSEICAAAPQTSLTEPSWIVDAPERVELSVKLEQPALLILADAYDTGWQAERVTSGGDPIPLTIFRANRVFRGVCLPAGEHLVIFRYRAWEIWVGGVISLLSWVIGLPAATLLGGRRWRKRVDGALHARFRRPPGTAE